MPVATWEPHPCSTGCGRTVDIIVGSTPREPLRCDPCRAQLGPRPAVHTTCDRDGCDQPVRVIGVQRRRWELGRPVYCSKACRTAATSWTESCSWCRTPLLVNRRRVHSRSTVYCSTDCSNSAQRNPERPCARCGKLFHPIRSSGRFCSRACGARGEGRVQLVERVCPVCGDRAMVHPDRARRPCSKSCSNTWRTMPDWEPKARTSPRTGSSQSSSRPQGSAPPLRALAPVSPH